ncbi:hypothetical protein L249_5779 [Ophiocordyceps polyrhachis-furcata BCC 54312]|uniref:Uncharacterized protein n=1 Tax=Ophiocordyceps polyrhachis-furcata BCC 54312 TaxID=1330021 RepID=A0A367L0U0_9HYPO|nr:hypothetical protein L249_5779 [Ophiocordyceps polyrhachis-furcata BCC 54312]
MRERRGERRGGRGEKGDGCFPSSKTRAAGGGGGAVTSRVWIEGNHSR